MKIKGSQKDAIIDQKGKSTGINRRSMIKSSVVIMGAAYVAPATLSLLTSTRATAQSALPFFSVAITNDDLFDNTIRYVDSTGVIRTAEIQAQTTIDLLVQPDSDLSVIDDASGGAGDVFEITGTFVSTCNLPATVTMTSDATLSFDFCGNPLEPGL